MEKGMTLIEILVALLIISGSLWAIVLFVGKSDVVLERLIEKEKIIQSRDF